MSVSFKNSLQQYSQRLTVDWTVVVQNCRLINKKLTVMTEIHQLYGETFELIFEIFFLTFMTNKKRDFYKLYLVNFNKL